MERAYTNYLKDANAHACWLFDDFVSGKLIDDAGALNQPCALANTTYATEANCKVGRCFEYNATTTIIRCGRGGTPNLDDMALESDLTVVAWINPDTTGEGGTGRIMSKRNTSADDDGGWTFFTDNTASLGFLTADTGGSVDAHYRGTDNAITLGEWTHVALVFDSTAESAQIYANAVEITYDTETTGDGPGTDAGDDFIIGNTTNSAATFDGHIDELCVFTRKLTQVEIQDIMDNGLK